MRLNFEYKNSRTQMTRGCFYVRLRGVLIQLQDIRKIQKLNDNPQLDRLLSGFGLTLPEETEDNLGIYEDGELIGCGFLKGNMLQGLAVSGKHQGSGLAVTLVTGLIKLAAAKGITYLRVISKPEMAGKLSDIGMRVVADASPHAVFLEYGEASINEQINHFKDLSADKEECCACVVVNCNPFTLGHRWLIETASQSSRWVWVIVVEEDRSEFLFSDRLQMVINGTKDLNNIEVISGGEYIISSTTFPAYFIKSVDLARAQASLDAAVFAKLIAPSLKIVKRFVGSEPQNATTNIYNQVLQEILPANGIEVVEIPRIELNGSVISASAVRACLVNGNFSAVREMVPESTWQYLHTEEMLAKIKERLNNTKKRVTSET